MQEMITTKVTLITCLNVVVDFCFTFPMFVSDKKESADATNFSAYKSTGKKM